MKKDILIMCQYFYPEYVSSAVLPTELAVDLASKGWSVDVLCGQPREYTLENRVPKSEVYKEVNIRRLSYLGLDKKHPVGRLLNFLSLMLAYGLRMPLLFKYKCILVYSNPPLLPLIPSYVSKLSKSSMIFVAFDVYPDAAIIHGAIKETGMIAKMMRRINKRVYRQANRVVALGTEMKEYLVDNGLTEEPDLVEVIPNWYSGQELKDHVIKSAEFRHLSETWPFIVLYSGNMGSLQDMDTILDCMLLFKNREDILFVFTGHGNKKPYVEEFIHRHKFDNAVVYGFLLGDDYADMLKIADLCLVSLSKGIEGLGVPSKTYGYLAAGKPVVAIMSDKTDIVTQIKEYNAGDHVRQGDVQGLARVFSNYLANPNLVGTHGQNARILFDCYYERSICTNQYHEMIKELIGKE